MGNEELFLKNKIPVILRVTPLDGYCLNIEFASGSTLKLNMKKRLHTVRYYPLNNRKVFCSATTDGSKIIFDTRPKFELDIFAKELIDIALITKGKGRGILRVQPLDKYRILIELNSDSRLELNMEQYLHTNHYRLLNDEYLFRSVNTDGNNLIFGNILHVGLEELKKLVLTEVKK